MNNLMMFENKQVEVFEWNGQVLFNPYHCGECLDLTESSVRNHLANMNSKQAILLKNSDVRNKDIRKLNNAGEKFLTESGVYKLIFKSKKAEAERFQDWVTDEVLPQIRKHGMYATDELLDNPDLLIEVATKLKEEREKNKALQEENAKQKQRIGELEPKADYTDLILKSKSIVAITQIAKDYGMSAQEMNNKLHELKVQYLVGKQWILYAKYQAKGYTHSETIPIKHKDGRADVNMITKWTQKGRLFIYDLLKENGILPMIEREVA